MATQRNFTPDEVQKKLQQIPTEVKSLLYSTEMTSAIQQVGERNKLHYDQMGALEIETSNVMLGFTETPDFAGILMKSLSVDQPLATAIAKDINDTLFSKIRDAMKQGSVKTNPDATANFKGPAALAMPHSDPKSVVMPSAAKAVGAEMSHPAPVTPTPAPTPAAKLVTPAPLATGSVTIPSAPATVTTPPAAPKTPMLDTSHVDAMLSQPTVSIAPKVATPAPATPTTPPAEAPKPVETAKVDPPQPGPIYKTDPYHEPID